MKEKKKKKWHPKKKPSKNRKYAGVNENDTISDVKRRFGIIPSIVDEIKSSSFKKFEFPFKERSRRQVFLNRSFRSQLLINFGYGDDNDVDDNVDDNEIEL